MGNGDYSYILTPTLNTTTHLISWTVSGGACTHKFVECDVADAVPDNKPSGDFSSNAASTFPEGIALTTDAYKKYYNPFKLLGEYSFEDLVLKNYDNAAAPLKKFLPFIFSSLFSGENPFELTESEKKIIGDPGNMIANLTEKELEMVVHSLEGVISTSSGHAKNFESVKDKIQNILMLKQLGIDITDADYNGSQLSDFRDSLNTLVEKCNTNCDIDSLLNDVIIQTMSQVRDEVEKIESITGGVDNFVPINYLLGLDKCLSNFLVLIKRSLFLMKFSKAWLIRH